jgi:predicted Zn-dependent protease
MHTIVMRSYWWGRAYGTLRVLSLLFLLAGCSIDTGAPTSRRPEPRPTTSASTTTAQRLDPQQAERLQRVMVPLLQHMNQPLSPREVQIGVLADPQINAANADGGEFYMTRGLLEKANDQQLRGVMAHEIAHADLNHVSKLQTQAAGVGLGVLLGSFALDQLLPGSGQLASQLGQVAGQYYLASYSRQEEYAADAHGVEILRRTGYNGKQIMVDTLSWLKRTAGDGGGGFFATHPETGDRIQVVRNLP